MIPLRSTLQKLFAKLKDKGIPVKKCYLGFTPHDSMQALFPTHSSK